MHGNQVYMDMNKEIDTKSNGFSKNLLHKLNTEIVLKGLNKYSLTHVKL